MRIGILTQPLKANYGGVLQNWALQQVLIKLGHEPITIDLLPRPSFFRYIVSTIKSLILWFIPSRRRKFIRWHYKRSPLFEKFVEDKIKKTNVCHRYSIDLVQKYHLNVLIVGSDQTWRPLYNRNVLYDMFLRFAKGFKGKKIAYAVSFGVDQWEFTEEQTQICSALVQSFDAVSVREESGVRLCKEYLKINAIPVLDPTLLVEKEAYLELCSNIPERREKFLAAYVLDNSDKVEDVIQEESKKRGLFVRYYYADRNAKLNVEEWISVFRDASFIVTDSFHGTVFSIIFEKPFYCIANSERGNARFIDLLGKYKSRVLEKWQIQSFNFLEESLS